MSLGDLAKKQLLALLKDAKNEDAARAALSIMFPQAKGLLGTEMLDTLQRHNERNSRRIEKADFAKNYFRLTPDTALSSTAEFEADIFSDPADVFRDYELRLMAAAEKDRPPIRRSLIELVGEALRDSNTDREAWFVALMDYAHILLSNEGWQAAALFDSSMEDSIRAMVTQALTDLSEDERVSLMKSAIDKASDISLLSELMRHLAGDVTSEGAPEKSHALGVATSDLRKRLLDRVRSLAAEGTLLDQAQPRDILWFWWGTGNGEEVLTFTKQAIETPEGLRALLIAPLSPVRSTAGNYEKVSRQSWNKIVDIRALEEKALYLSMQGDVDGAIAQRFLNALQKDNGL
ncbi:hypothetical protein B5M44_10595 [Shinella sumterensis]|uniref:hypothetical protein n=1 Tax=Shinella sumterensis TaxID=1967501 RepID=UPI00106E12C3|nr:hypothetical protein [Shinella sumterensis]MCD1264574.1 hypothetical protein [Shinella sumterensis]TFE98471.1 hypothetical protein B5M44_10595 [Shinella sumterensis]